MFDIGFSELVVIAIVALIVIGPERLPKVARTVGHLFGRMQRYVNDVRADIVKEMDLEELRKMQSSMEDAARSLEQTIHSNIRETESALEEAVKPETSSESKADARPEPASVESSPQLELTFDATHKPTSSQSSGPSS